MKNIREAVHDVIEQRILPWIQRDGISKLLLPEQITADHCATPMKCNRPCRRRHREDELAIGLIGEVAYCINNVRFIFTPGRILLLPAGTPHMADKGSRKRTKDLNLNQTPSILWLHASTFGVIMQIGFLADNSYLLTQPHIFVGRDFGRLLSCLLEEARSRPTNYTRLGRYILLEFIERCLRVTIDTEAVGAPELYEPGKDGAKELPEMVQAALEFIYSHYRMPISLDDIAASADTSASHLSKCFKDALGWTPIAYLLHIRISAAKELLATDMKVSEIAGLVGIHDPAYFSRVFGRSEGITPLAFRRRTARKTSVSRADAKGRKSVK